MIETKFSEPTLVNESCVFLSMGMSFKLYGISKWLLSYMNGYFMHFQVVFSVLLIDLLGLISPGPDFFMVLKNSLSYSHKAGIYTALGIGIGSFICFSIGFLGIGALFLATKWIFVVIKIIGATYLGYLALKAIFSKVSTMVEPELIKDENQQNIVASGYFFKLGLFCNLTNPKALLFIVSLATYAVSHGAQTLIDSITVILVTTLNTVIWFTLVAQVFGRAKIRNMFYKRQRLINIFFGCLLLYVVATIIML